ncbi:MAG: InlB B-repeat-containing protein, partial [Oscillospiraceae bacterium]|nr:InlB B-repeat-containing protein [Oscillospiraceae bacterium]
VFALKNLRINAAIGLVGGPSYNYDAETGETIVPLTSGVSAEYTLRIVSTLDEDAEDFQAYIPVPHTGENYGSHFQSEEFEWNMALHGPPANLPENYIVTYSTNDIVNNGEKSATYEPADQITNWAAVTMIKIVYDGAIPPGADDTIVFTYDVNDAPDTAVFPALVNVFNPYFYKHAGQVATWIEGGSVAVSLTTGEISGRVWDNTNRDGVLTGSESGRSGVQVRLLLPGSGTGSDYGTNPTIAGVTTGTGDQGKYAQVVTDANGYYVFPQVPSGDGITYDVQVINPDPTNLEFTEKDAGNNDEIDSDVDRATGIVSGVNPTNMAVSKFIWAGLRAIEYIVTFDKNGGDEDASPPSYKVTRPATHAVLPGIPPRKACHTFNGYFTVSDASGGTEFTEATDVNSSQTVYARWSLNKYTVTYSNAHATGGTAPNAHIDVDCNSTVSVNTDGGSLTRTGYTFGGWSATDGGTTPVTSIPNINASQTLYPIWNKKSYTVQFDPNGGNGSPESASGKQIGDDIPLSAAAAALGKPGYALLGFSTNSVATAADYTGDFTLDASEINALMSGDTQTSATLYAVWSQKNYNIIFNSNGGSGSPSNVTGAHVGDTIPIANAVAALSRTGYDLLGFSLDKDSATAAYSANFPLDADALDAIMDGDTKTSATMYAIWSKRSYDIHFLPNGGSGTPPDVAGAQIGASIPAAAAMAALSRPGYALRGFSANQNATTATYTNDFTLNASQINNLMQGDTTTSADLYAVWSQKLYAVTFSANGGRGNPPKVSGAMFGDTIPVASAMSLLSRPGYTLLGFSADKNASSPTYTANFPLNDSAIDSIMDGDTKSAATLYAVWAKKTYTFKISSEGGSPVTYDDVSVGDIIPLDELIAAMQKPGYTLRGFATTPNAKTARYTRTFTLTEADVAALESAASSRANEVLTLYAVYEIIEVIDHVIFDTVADNWQTSFDRRSRDYWDILQLTNMKIYTNKDVGAADTSRNLNGK